MARFYTIESANGRLVELRPLLAGLRADRDRVAELQAQLIEFRTTNGNATHAEEVARREGEIAEVVRRMEAAVRQVDAWDVTLRDIGSGLIDFPALVSGRPIWLCWRLGEDDVAWWHEVTTGFGGRKPLAELT
jgi:hypothetical protein